MSRSRRITAGLTRFLIDKGSGIDDGFRFPGTSGTKKNLSFFLFFHHCY
jgi:hypothetical protein